MSNFKTGVNLTESLNNLEEFESSLHRISDEKRVSVTYNPIGLQNGMHNDTGKIAIGHIGKYNSITDNDGSPKGSIDGFGNIVDTSGRVKGSIDKFNNVIDSSGRVTGHIDKYGNIYKK